MDKDVAKDDKVGVWADMRFWSVLVFPPLFVLFFGLFFCMLYSYEKRRRECEAFQREPASRSFGFLFSCQDRAMNLKTYSMEKSKT